MTKLEKLTAKIEKIQKNYIEKLENMKENRKNESDIWIDAENEKCDTLINYTVEFIELLQILKTDLEVKKRGPRVFKESKEFENFFEKCTEVIKRI